MLNGKGHHLIGAHLFFIASGLSVSEQQALILQFAYAFVGTCIEYILKKQQ